MIARCAILPALLGFSGACPQYVLISRYYLAIFVVCRRVEHSTMALTETINAHKKNSHLLMTVFDVFIGLAFWFSVV